MKKIKNSTFTIVANGFADGPAQALRDYLISKGAVQVVTVSHPLVAEGDGNHVVNIYSRRGVKKKSYKFPNKPPYTYIFDPFVPISIPKTTVWFGFNNLASYRGLYRRNRGKADKVIYWAVDFVPDRFGPGFLTKLYNLIDRKVSYKVDARIELAETGLKGRNKYLGLNIDKMAPAYVSPMGSWLKRTPKTTKYSWEKQKVVYLGHLVERQGVATLINATDVLLKKGIEIEVDIIGSGPLEQELKQLVKKQKLQDRITFHGFIESHKEVENILALSTIAAAPYTKDEKSFTQYADPGKLKAYLGAGLPIVLTDVPPNAKELEDEGVAIVVKDSVEEYAAGLERLLSNNILWEKSRKNVYKYAKQFDWDNILQSTLKKIGFE